MNRISVVMIVKNEEALLARCLESVKDADEIIICDTGSKDKTLDVAKEWASLNGHADRMLFTHFEWCDDFSKARNHAKAQATGDWILTIDADEVLTCPFADVRAAAELGFMAVNVKMTSEYGAETQFWFPKLFRNSKQVWWVGAIHNHLSVLGEDISQLVTITFGYSPAHADDRGRTLRILEREVATRPDAVRESFYLGREYYYRKMYEKALPVLGRYVQQSRFLPEKAEAFLIMARAYWELRMADDARDAIAQALIINPHFKEAVLFMATLAGDGSANALWQRNADQWKRMAETADNQNVLFVRVP